MRAHSIRPIDLLVVNLYPFETTTARGADFADCIENIDIGGPAMIRAAAKNHDDVAVVVEASDYAAVLAELAQHAGATTLALRRRLAAKAYARTAAYDAAISNWFAAALGDIAPDYRAFGGRLIEKLRYGENPHQAAAFYRTPDARFGVSTVRLSSTPIRAAWRRAKSYSMPIARLLPAIRCRRSAASSRSTARWTPKRRAR
jgi:phosphoribosylaminoimidazolecarboxamide formyltransferase/IMP cyclohydrolase